MQSLRSGGQGLFGVGFRFSRSGCSRDVRLGVYDLLSEVFSGGFLGGKGVQFEESRMTIGLLLRNLIQVTIFEKPS